MTNTANKTLTIPVKVLSALVLTVLILLLAASCAQSDRSDDTNPLFPLNPDKENPSDKQKYVIVIPDHTAGIIYDKAVELSGKITHYTEGSTEIIAARLVPYNTKTGNFIFVGKTSFEESKLLYNILRAGEFGYLSADNNIVIGGFWDTDTVAAIDKFITDVLPYTDGISLLDKSKEYIKRVEFPFDYINLNGTDIADFTIVYPAENTLDEKRAATALRTAIVNLSGFYLEVKDDTEKAEHAIRISANGEPGKIIYTTEKGSLTISAADTYGLSLGIKQFLNLIEENKIESRAEVLTESLVETEYTAPDLTFLHFDARGESAINIIRANSNENGILYSFSGMSAETYIEIIRQSVLMKSTAHVRDGLFSGYFFDSSKLIEKESGKLNCEGFRIIYSRFVISDTGEEFLYFLVDFTIETETAITAAAQILEETAAAYGGIPIFAATNLSSAETDAIFGAGLSTLKSGKTGTDPAKETHDNYFPLIYTDYGFFDTKEYKETASSGNKTASYVVIRFRKLWAM